MSATSPDATSSTSTTGGAFGLYRYHRFQDVRLVFAPEQDAAFFGGDPDNFPVSPLRPRHGVALRHAYENGQPAHYTRLLPAPVMSGPREGDLTFVLGHPGSTQRQLTVAQLAARARCGFSFAA